MTNKKCNKIVMALVLEDVCDANTTLLPQVPAFQEAYADAQTRVSNLQNLAQTQTQDTTGIALDKKHAREVMCQTALPIAGAIHAYATKNNSEELLAKSDCSLSDLLAGRDVQSAERCQNVFDLATANLTELADYGLTAAKLT